MSEEKRESMAAVVGVGAGTGAGVASGLGVGSGAILSSSLVAPPLWGPVLIACTVATAAYGTYRAVSAVWDWFTD